MDENYTIPVAEIFGPTIQGEGPDVGKRVMFVRVNFCDFHCDWCDSSWVWHQTEKTIRYTPKDLALKILYECKHNNCYSVIITGGNPCIYDLDETIDILQENGIHIGIETQGSLLPQWLCKVDTLVFSPKAPSSKQPDTYDSITSYIDSEQYKLHQSIAIKIPVFDNEDIEYAKKFSRYVNQKYIQDDTIKGILRMYLSVGNSNTTEDGDISKRILNTYENLLNIINQNSEGFENVYILPQVHTLIWGNKSGV